MKTMFLLNENTLEDHSHRNLEKNKKIVDRYNKV